MQRLLQLTRPWAAPLIVLAIGAAFWGSEPVTADSGKYAGTSVLQDEQNKGLGLMQSLNADQQRRRQHYLTHKHDAMHGHVQAPW